MQIRGAGNGHGEMHKLLGDTIQCSKQANTVTSYTESEPYVQSVDATFSMNMRPTLADRTGSLTLKQTEDQCINRSTAQQWH